MMNKKVIHYESQEEMDQAFEDQMGLRDRICHEEQEIEELNFQITQHQAGIGDLLTELELKHGLLEDLKQELAEMGTHDENSNNF